MSLDLIVPVYSGFPEPCREWGIIMFWPALASVTQAKTVLFQDAFSPRTQFPPRVSADRRIRGDNTIFLLLFFLHRAFPAGDMGLFDTADDQFVFPHITGDRGACPNGGAVGHLDRRDQLAIRTDKHIVADHRLVLVGAIVVTGNDTRADVHAGADIRVAEGGQMAGF